MVDGDEVAHAGHGIELPGDPPRLVIENVMVKGKADPLAGGGARGREGERRHGAVPGQGAEPFSKGAIPDEVPIASDGRGGAHGFPKIRWNR